MNLFDHITFPFGATSDPYSKVSPHKGNDYASAEGTRLVVAGTQIGLVGSTGWASGPHVHVQAGRDEWAQTAIDPTPYTDKPGTVVKTGVASQWGNYVCLRVEDVNVFYCHLKRVDVQSGQVIGEGGDMPLTESQQDKVIKMGLRREPRADELNNPDWRNNPGLLIDTLWGNGGEELYHSKSSEADKKLQAIKDALGIS